jgi:hypothetical protein
MTVGKIKLFVSLYRHLKLSERRSTIWEQNKVARYLMWIMGIFVVGYMIFLAIMLAMDVNEDASVTGYEFMYGIIPFLLTADFIFRFMALQSPSQYVKPYRLMPIPKRACINTFILCQLLSSYNLIWFALFIPFAFLTILKYGIICVIGFCLGLYLLILINALWYMLARSLTTASTWWWAAIGGVYAVLFMPFFIKGIDAITSYSTTFGLLGKGFTFLSPLHYISVIAGIAVFFIINSRVQYYLTSKEVVSNKDKTTIATYNLGFLSRTGIIGEYIRIEIYSLMRNKNHRKGFVSSILLTCLYSLTISFTSAYDDGYMIDFWCIYCFAIFGMMIIRIMGYEGNYIDMLMAYREQIYNLLLAKYYFYCAMLLLPLILLLPTVIMGKCSILMLVAYMIFTSGFVYFLFFQMAIYNKQTLPLNKKYIGKGNVQSTSLQLVFTALAFVAPMMLIKIITLIFPNYIAHLFILFIGLAFVCFHKRWMHNIYERMMKKKYENMESFRATR